MNILDARYLKVCASVRYWDYAEINGFSDESGNGVPFKDGDSWTPIIDLQDGSVVDWPKGNVGKFHFKVCDGGEYYLLDENMSVIAERLNNYVPDGLCHGDKGYGDYIIFNVDESGKILKYRNLIDEGDWIESDE